MSSKATPAPSDLQRAARVAGLNGNVLPSLEQVERRRFELWLLSTGLLVALTVALGILSFYPAADVHDLLEQPAVRFGLFGLAAVLSAYSVEKEMSLRRVSSLLVDERLLTTALTNRLHEISALLDAGRAVNSTLELDRVLMAILSGATDLLPATRGTVLLLEDDHLAVAAEAGFAGRDPLSLPDPYVDQVIVELQPLRVDTQDGNVLCVPLIEREQALGALYLVAPTTESFSDYDVRAVSLFAEQAAAAIGKARLYEQSKVQAEQLSYAATHDALTDLYNRAALAERVGEGRPEALLFLDLDGFKEINDAHGHKVGDELLVAVGDRLIGCVSDRDMVCRYGGDEFAVLLEGRVDAEMVARIATQILEELRRPVRIDGLEVTVSASLGIAVPRGPASLDTLLQQADRALYEAKARGKAQACVFTPDLALPAQPQPAADDGLTPVAST
jgi:diguanylate cyclase (GGDEF)-like protein